MNNMNYLFAAYTIIWICLSVFLLRLAGKIGKAEKELSHLQKD